MDISRKLDNRFKEFDPKENVRITILKYSEKHNLPIPGKFLNSGNSALVFESDDPTIVIRADEDINSNENQLIEFQNDEDFVDGIVKIHHFSLIDVVHDVKTVKYLVTWKEKVNDDVERYLYKKYDKKVPGSTEFEHTSVGRFDVAEEIMKSLSLYHNAAAKINNLMKYPETKGLAKAIKSGLPCADLDLHHNLGVNNTGKIVAYDI